VVPNPANFAFCGVILQVIQSVIEIQAINKYRKRHQMMRHMIDYKNHSLTQPAKPKLLDQVRAAICCHHYSWRTEKTYVHWIKRFIFFHGKRHPRKWAATIFLSSGKRIKPQVRMKIFTNSVLYRT
jgi:hypothetical protein